MAKETDKTTEPTEPVEQPPTEQAPEQAAIDPAPAPQAQPPVVNVTLVQPDRAAEGARAMLEGKALEMDKTIPGGRYLVNGQLVNANGEPLGTKLAANEALR